MQRFGEVPEDRDEFEGLDDDEISKRVEADFQAMMEEAVAEANAVLSDNPDELAYINANYSQLMKGNALQKAAHEALQAGDFTLAKELEQQKMAELSQVLERAGNQGGLASRAASWLLRRTLGR